MGIDAVMMVTTEEEMTDDDILLLARRCHTAFPDALGGNETEGDKEHSHPCIWRVVSEDSLPDNQNTLFWAHWTQQCYDPGFIPDGAAMMTRLRVGVAGRYRGKDCQNGDTVCGHIAVASWLEHYLPGCQVWYGGTNFNTLSLFDKTARKKLWEDFCRFAREN